MSSLGWRGSGRMYFFALVSVWWKCSRAAAALGPPLVAAPQIHAKALITLQLESCSQVASALPNEMLHESCSAKATLRLEGRKMMQFDGRAASLSLSLSRPSLGGCVQL